MSRAIVALGSNLGDRYQHLREAVVGLGDTLLVVSGVYESPPWGDPDQPAYLNAVALVASDCEPRDWLRLAQEIEERGGRSRDPDRRYAPRTVDVDVIAVWTDEGEPVVSDDPELTLPHPRAHLRAFVLRPWLDVQPYAQLPGGGWVGDLVRTEPVAADLGLLRPCADLPLWPDEVGPAR